MKRAMIIATVLLAAGLGGCRATMDLPASFVDAGRENRGIYDLRAVSADGAVLAARRQENPQKGTLEFWVDAVRNEMTTARGYALTGSEAVTSAGGTPGRLMTFSATRQGVQYTYLLAVYRKGPDVLIAEAGGKADVMAARAGEVRQALLTAR
jgi:hypothetical protein